MLYKHRNYRKLSNRLNDDYYVPISILVPAHNEELTVVATVKSLLELHYRLYEIIVIDDGSTDNTAKELIEHFHMKKINRPVRKQIKTKSLTEIYEADEYKVKLTLVRKENGGKADALNVGINMSECTYFMSLDADSMLQDDSLENIAKPILEDERIIACGGVVRISNGLEIIDGKINE